MSETWKGKILDNKTLYVDNYRGFQNVHIPLKSVNFMVGENSTGKSSILALIALLSYPQFWFLQDFNCSGIHLGTFKDMISVNNTKEKSFRIGYVEWQKRTDSKKYSYKAFLLQYIERDGLPVANEISYLGADSITRCRINKKTLSYTRKKIPVTQMAPEEVASIFDSWTKESYTKYEKRISHHEFGISSLFNVDFFISQNEKIPPTYNPFSGMLLPYSSLVWIAPIRTKPKRTYDEYSLDFSSEGTHTPYLIRSLQKDKKLSRAFNEYLQKVGRTSGLFTEVRPTVYGSSPTAPFSLDVVLHENALPLSSVGYGVSQSLPVIVELYSRGKGTNFAIQQPEVHLHPRAQAALGEIIYDMAQEDQKTMFIETHSDYTIDRFRLRCRKASASPPSQILFFARTENGNNVISIPILTNGDYSEDQPEDFRSFFLHEELSMLGLN